MNKKAILFSIISVIIVSTLIILVKPSANASLDEKIPALKQRVSAADLHIKSLTNQYFKDAIQDSTYRAMRAYNAYLKDKGSFAASIDKARLDLKELILYGSVDGVKLNETVPVISNLMENHTLIERIALIENLSIEYLNYDTRINLLDLVVYQSNFTGPYKLGVNANVSIFLNVSVAYWDLIKEINTSVSIIQLEDLFYTLNTNPSVPMYYKETNLLKWNISHFRNFSANRTYSYYKKGASYLQRLANTSVQTFAFGNSVINLSNCCGLESIINESDSYKKGGQYKNESFIDYCYFLEACGDYLSYHNITVITTPTYPFQLDLIHINRYNLTDQMFGIPN